MQLLVRVRLYVLCDEPIAAAAASVDFLALYVRVLNLKLLISYERKIHVTVEYCI